MENKNIKPLKKLIKEPGKECYQEENLTFYLRLHLT